MSGSINPSTVWATLAGVYGPQGAIPFIASDGIAPTIDVTNFYYDQTYKQLFIGFAALAQYSRYGINGPAGLVVENGVDSYVSITNQANGKVAQHSVSSARGTAQVPSIPQAGDLLGKFSARSYNVAVGDTDPSWNDFFQMLVYVAGASATNPGSAVDFKIKLNNGNLVSFLTVLQDLSMTLAGDLVVNGNMIINGSISIPGLIINTVNLVDHCVTAVKESDDAFYPVASAATVDIGAINSRNILIQGTVSINSLGSAPAGRRKICKFDSVLTIVPGLNAIYTPGVSASYPYGQQIVTATDDEVMAVSRGPGLGWTIEQIMPVSGFSLLNALIPQNSKYADYTLIWTDAGKCIFHPAADANARTFTIPANASVAFPIGAVVQFINRSANNVTIAINADTLTLGQGSTTAAGSTGSRTLAQYGIATAQKIGTTEWIITGVGLT